MEEQQIWINLMLERVEHTGMSSKWLKPLNLFILLAYSFMMVVLGGSGGTIHQSYIDGACKHDAIR